MSRDSAKILILFISISIPTISICYTTDFNTNVYVINEMKHDLSSPLLSSAPEELFNTFKDQKKNNIMTTGAIPFKVYDGLGHGFGKYVVKELIPDVNGSVGVKQFVQMVNYDIGVFDKASGKIFPGFPLSNQALWQGFGGECENEIGKFPMVKYDQLAHQWILTQTTQNQLCIAISTGENASKKYYRYAYNLSTKTEYAKLGLWPNAYFMAFDTMEKGSFKSSLICALDRKKMLQGHKADMQCHLMDKLSLYMMPVDLEGDKLPTDNEAGYFVGHTFTQDEYLQYHSIDFLKFFPNFGNPSKSKISRLYNLLTPYPQWNNIYLATQPNGKILEIDLRHLDKIIYRQFKDHGSMIASFRLPGNDLSSIWQEYWVDGNKLPVVHQGAIYYSYQNYSYYTGNFSIDNAGNIVFVTNVSSSLIYPSIEVRARQPGDPLNKLPYRQALVTGHGAQTATPNKWGDYSSVSIDPVDNCTFWATNPYLKSSGQYNWSTAIISLKWPNCH